MEKEEKEVLKKEEKVESKDEKANSKYRGWIFVVGAIILFLIILFLLHSCCGGGKKYQIKLHYGDDVMDVDQDFKLDDLEVDGGKITFLVDSDGHIVDPNSKLDPEKEYSAHIIPDGKEKVKVTYKWDNNSLTIEYQKGAGLLFPEDPKKSGYVFIGWKFEDQDDYPLYMMPVEHDMTLVAVFEKSKEEGGKCTLNCDTNKDGLCDLNCDKNGDGKADTNVDTNGDGKADTNVDKNHDGICELNCDTNGDGKPDTNVDTNGDGNPDTNIDIDGDGKCDLNCDTDGDGKCDKNCDGGLIITNVDKDYNFGCNDFNMAHGGGYNSNDQYAEKVINFVVDGKKLEPTSYSSTSVKYFDYSYLIGSGKTVKYVMDTIREDKTGQKYYKHWEGTFTFEGNCDKKQNETKEEIIQLDENKFEYNFKCIEKKENTVYLYQILNVREKDNIISSTIDGKETKLVTIGDFLALELTEYVGSGKTIEVVIKLKDRTLTYKLTYASCDGPQLEYKLTFDPNGGTVNPTSMVFYKGQYLADLPFPTRSGYQFVGWYTAKSGGELITDETKMPENDMTIYAQWESNETPKQTYTLTFNANGGSVTPTSRSLKEGSLYGNLPVPTRKDYTFDGWYTKASGGNKVSSSTKITGNTTIYAHWTKSTTPTKTYTLTYNANGGSVSPTSKTLNEGATYGELPTPTRDGYTFDGWYTSASGGNKVSSSTTITGNTTIYAHWTKSTTPTKTYTLTYNANGGSVSPTSKTLNEGAAYGELPTPTRTDYTFDGWYTSASGGNKVTANTAITGNTTIYAHWTKKETVDNGTISLSSSSSNNCAISGQRVNITATVTNALDDTVTWTADRCITINGSGKTVTVIANGCGSSATVTGTLNNGKSSSITLKVESTLTVTVKTRYGTAAEYDSNNGLYLGNDLIISTNIPAYITAPGNQLLGDASALRTSAQTNGATQATVTIKTPCGQTKTIKTYPVIN